LPFELDEILTIPGLVLIRSCRTPRYTVSTVHSLRQRLFLSYAFLGLGILGGAVWSIYQFAILGHSVRLIMSNNYRSVVDAQNMKETLERQDSAMTCSYGYVACAPGGLRSCLPRKTRRKTWQTSPPGSFCCRPSRSGPC